MVTLPSNEEVCSLRGAVAKPRRRAWVCSSWTLMLLAGSSPALGCGSSGPKQNNWDDSSPLLDNTIDQYGNFAENRLRSDDLKAATSEPAARAAAHDDAQDGAGAAASDTPSASDSKDNGNAQNDNGQSGPRNSAAPEPPAPPLPFVSIDQRLDALEADLNQFQNPTDRQRIRYIDFSNLSNAGVSGVQLEWYRQAVSLLVNSLSRGGAIVPPRAVDDDRLFYALDLRDYAWNAATWDAIDADYPYAVSYNQDSRLLPFDEQTAQNIRQDTQTNIPYLQADWFLAHASSAPLYYNVLQIPGNINQLAQSLGVDITQDIRDQQVARAGFNSSGVALNNRVIERHEQPGSGGAFWLTYDFRASVDVRNVFAHPVDFQQDAIEGLFTLENGLSGYFLANANFGRVNKAATDIVTDPNSRDHAVQAGVSCMGGCHLARGVELKDDEVRNYVVLSAPDARTIDETLALYAARDQMTALTQADSQHYAAAVLETGYKIKDENAINEMVRTHEDTLDLNTAASVLGVPQGTLSNALSASPQVFPAEILPLRDAGALIHRETLDSVFANIVAGLGRGTTIRP